MSVLKAEGIAVIVVMILVCLILLAIGIYCDFCADTFSGGKYFPEEGENPTIVVYTPKMTRPGSKTSKWSESEDGSVKVKCKCSKASCKHCAGEDFNINEGNGGLDPNESDPFRADLGDGGRSGDGGGGFGMMRDD